MCIRDRGGVMPLMAKAAAMSGAVGIRANTVRDITQIKKHGAKRIKFIGLLGAPEGIKACLLYTSRGSRPH